MRIKVYGSNGKPAKHCEWSFGDPRSKHFKFCGQLTLVGRSYCALHLQQAYEQPAETEKEAV